MNLAQFLKENPDISSRTNHKDNDDLCIICHEKTNKKDRAFIPCNHNMHWKCLLESINVSFISGVKESCPYCRQSCGFNRRGSSINNNKCNYILTRGPRKGEKCNKNCHISGNNTCKQHNDKFR